jgi:AcrR family transcriptional regulator
MADRVKPRRRYDSPRRRDQAAATRRQILDAAQRLFERQGYAATSMAAIASEAGVALKTVYIAFDTKSGLLRAVWHRQLRGDEEPVPVPERAWFREVLDEPDAERQLRLAARASVAVKVRAGALIEVIRAAAPGDPDIADLWRRIQIEFHDNQRSIVESLAEKGALKRGLDVARASDIMWTLNHPSVYWLLANDRRWSAEEYERWLTDLLRAQLLRRPSS